MNAAPPTSERKIGKVFASYAFWLLVAMLAAIGFLHYFTPQMRTISPQVDVFLSRHAVERIIFIIPIAGATFAYGHLGGLVTLALSILIMLPRAIWISAYPVDAFLEIAATSVVSYLVVWMIETQEREKKLREEAVEDLKRINVIATTANQSLDLDEILNTVLGQVLEALAVVGPEPMGAIYLYRGEDRVLHLRVHRGFSTVFAQPEAEPALRQRLVELLSGAEDSVFAIDLPGRPQGTGWEEPDVYVVTSLKAKNRVLGAMLLRVRGELMDQHQQMLESIGNQIGMAVENARLYENLQFYVREITRAQENERKRIAQELHDETIQMLIAISRRLEGFAPSNEALPEAVTQSLAQVRELTTSAVRGVRRFVQDLRPPALDHLGLVAALKGMIANLEEKDGIEAQLTVEGEVRRLMPEEELVLFRIAQEGLNNIRRHAGATWVSVLLVFSAHRVQLYVEDNGRGFNAPERIGDLVSTGQLGLIGMQERARTLGGTLQIESEVGRGTKVVVDVPVH